MRYNLCEYIMSINLTTIRLKVINKFTVKTGNKVKIIKEIQIDVKGNMENRSCGMCRVPETQTCLAVCCGY